MTPEPFDIQLVVNAIFSVVFTVLGILLKTLWAAYKSLQEQDAALADKVHKIDTLVQGEYLKRAEFIAHTDKVSTQYTDLRNHLDNLFERLNQKLDNKADKGRS